MDLSPLPRGPGTVVMCSRSQCSEEMERASSICGRPGRKDVQYQRHESESLSSVAACGRTKNSGTLWQGRKSSKSSQKLFLCRHTALPSFESGRYLLGISLFPPYLSIVFFAFRVPVALTRLHVLQLFSLCVALMHTPRHVRLLFFATNELLASSTRAQEEDGLSQWCTAE